MRQVTLADEVIIQGRVFRHLFCNARYSFDGPLHLPMISVILSESRDLLFAALHFTGSQTDESVQCRLKFWRRRPRIWAIHEIGRPPNDIDTAPHIT
jgi:hypothetical protein